MPDHYCKECGYVDYECHCDEQREKMMRSPEGWEKIEIKRYLDAIPGCWYFSPSMTGFGKGGIPDLVGCYKGRFFSVEVKREDRIPTKLQNQRMWEIVQAGGKVFWGVSKKVIAEFELWKNSFAAGWMNQANN